MVDRGQMVEDTILFKLFRDYFKFYLPRMRECSPHTLRSYRTAINTFLDFVKIKHDITLDKITFEMLDAETLTDYLDSLDASGNGASTRKLRLSCIKAFYAYAADIEPTAVIHTKAVSKITVGKSAKTQIARYLSEEALKALLSRPNATTQKGLRDQFFLLLMYDTGARLQEIRGLRLRDISWGKTVNVVVNGKGGKIRAIPIMKPTVLHLKNYCKVFHPDVAMKQDSYSEAPLFYTEQCGVRNPFSDSIARKIVRNYGDMAKEICSEVPDIIHPHLLRHTRAMHLYQRGMSLIEIQQWLGHNHHR